MQQRRLFSEFICSQYQAKIADAIENFAIDNASSFNLRVIDTVSEVECDSIYAKNVWIRNLPDLGLEFDLAVEADLNFLEHSYRKEEEESITQWFLISGCVDFGNIANGITINDVQLYEAKFQARSDYTNSLSPCIYEKDTEKIAEKFLSQFFPETLEKECKVDVNAVVDRMGLNVEKHHLSSDLHIFGQILFETSKTEIFDKSNEPYMEEFKGGTILIDDQVFFLCNYGSARHTIIHECIHWYLHRKTFLLAKFMKQAESGFKCCITGQMQAHEQSNDAWFLEWQANKIAAKVLVPEIILKAKFKECAKKERELHPKTVAVYLLGDIMRSLSNYFGVSLKVIKIRLEECGLNIARGTFDYCDGRYLEPYAFKKNALEHNETFTIGCQDLIIEKIKNPELDSLMDNAQLVYTDSHLVVNNPRYVENKKLTEYARLHLDECAIKFSLDMHQKKKGDVFYRECILLHGYDGNLQISCTFKEEANKNAVSKAKAILRHQRNVNDLFDCIVATSFSQTLINLMKKKGITIEALANDSGVSPRQITRLRTGETENPSLTNVVALAIALDLPQNISLEFLKIAGYTLRRNTTCHMMYDFFLSDGCLLSVEECNELLVAKELKPLTD